MERQEIADTIKSTMHELFALNKDYTMDGFEKKMSLFIEPNDEAWMNNPALFVNMLQIVEDKEIAREDMIRILESRTGTIYDIEKEYVAVLSPESAIYVFKGTFSIIRSNGVSSANFPMTGSYVFVLRDDGWKILHMHQTWTN